ncbi:MAG: hypothetical protein R2878_10420 [Thermoleophilia bacterium]
MSAIGVLGIGAAASGGLALLLGPSSLRSGAVLLGTLVVAAVTFARA